MLQATWEAEIGEPGQKAGLYFQNRKRARGMVEHLSSKCKTLSSNPITTKKKTNKNFF
jgi:hypothetical protein